MFYKILQLVYNLYRFFNILQCPISSQCFIKNLPYINSICFLTTTKLCLHETYKTIYFITTLTF